MLVKSALYSRVVRSERNKLPRYDWIDKIRSLPVFTAPIVTKVPCLYSISIANTALVIIGFVITVMSEVRWRSVGDDRFGILRPPDQVLFHADRFSGSPRLTKILIKSSNPSASLRI